MSGSYTLKDYKPVIHPMIMMENFTGSRDHFKTELFEKSQVYEMDINYHGLGYNFIQQGLVKPAIPLPVGSKGKPLVEFAHMQLDDVLTLPGPESSVAQPADVTKYEGWDVQDYILDPKDIPDRILDVGNPGGAKKAAKENAELAKAQKAVLDKANA